MIKSTGWRRNLNILCNAVWKGLGFCGCRGVAVGVD